MLDAMNTKNHFGGKSLLKNENNQRDILSNFLSEKLGFDTVNVASIEGGKLRDDFEGYKKLWIFLCNMSDKKIFYPFGNPNHLTFNLHKERPTRCSLWVCELGIYIMDRYGDVNSVLTKSSSREVFYIAIDTTLSNYNLIFSTYTYEGDNIPLVPCPHSNWIHPINIMKFYPRKYISDNGIFIDKDFRRHVLVLGIPTDRYKDVLICGKIDQVIYEHVIVGIRIKKTGNHTNYKKIQFENDMKIKCDGEFVDLEHVHLYTPPNTFHYGNRMIGKKIDPKSYYVFSGQRVITFKKDKYKKIIENEYYNGNLEEEFFEKRIPIKPNCVGKVEDINATLKLKLNDHIFDYQNYLSGEKFIKIDVSKKNLTIDAGCEAVSDTKDERFKKFYKLKYKYILNKLTNNISEEVKYIDTNDSPRQIFGNYYCQIESPHENVKIKSFTFILLPKIDRIVSENIKVIPKSLNLMSCNKVYMEIGDLIEAEVKLKDGTKIKITSSPESFEDLGDSIAFKNYDKENINYTVLSCHYNAFGKEFVTTQKVFNYNNNEDDNNLSIPL